MAFKVLTGGIAHETNTFSIVPTTLDNFRRRGAFLTANAVADQRRGTRTAMGGSFESAEKYGWALRSPIDASANPSGTVTDEAFETLAGLLLAEADGIDGALLHLHGAMVTASHQDGEGEILRRLRAKVGPNVPIVVTLDLHGNITQLMADSANALIAVRTYPHIDHYEQSLRGAALLDRAMRGEIKPRTVIAKRPMLKGLDGGRTQTGPMRELIDRGAALEDAGEALIVSVCAGFTAADIHDIGPSVTVTTDDNNPRGQQIADAFMDYAWAERAFTSVRHRTIPEAIAYAKAAGPRDKPLVMAEVTDNPGSGHYGDATNILAAMIAADLQNAAFYAIYDPAAVQQGIAIGVGKTGRITLGGKHDPAAGGPPLELDARVVSLTDGYIQCFGAMGGGVWRDYGPSMLIRVGGIEIAVITNNGQATDTAQFTSLGCDPTRKTTILIKSNHHFRAAFEPLASEVITVDGGGLGSVILGNPQGYKRVRRPIWPLDEI